MELKVCKENKLCKDCIKIKCLHANDNGADCPKWTCDNKKPMDCDHCSFIKEYQKDMRNKS